MASSLFVLLDDISSMLDDVALLTKVAAKKTSAVMGDDLALNAEQASGVRVDRELPVVWAVAKGSLLNKVILLPLALLISAFLPWAVMPLMMIGGLFLCYEGVEKVLHKFQGGAEHAQTHPALSEPELTREQLLEIEHNKVKGAIRTDFVLSAEIIVIALGTMASAPIAVQIGALSLVGVAATVFVYGLVAGIVKLDDLGLALHERGIKAGRLILRTAPWLMKALSALGTAAMFTVGGGILAHGLHSIDALLERWANYTGIMDQVSKLLLDAALGAAAGSLLVAATLAVKAFKTNRPQR